MKRFFQSRYVTEDNQKFFEITQWAYLIGFFGHISAVPAFLGFEVTEMVYFNLLYSIPCFALAFVLNRFGKHNIAFTLAFIELLFHQVLSTYYMGWSFGAHFWLIYLAGLCFFNPSWKTPVQLGLLTIILGSYVYLYFNHQSGIYGFAPEAFTTNRLSNALSAIVLIALLINHYSRATRKAEKRLRYEQEITTNMLDKVGALFGQQVSEEIARELISSDLDFASKSCDVSVMFMDIRDFTLFADSHEPNEVARFQNTVFGELIQIVKEHRGVVLQVLGDGIMAVFGAPDPNPQHAQMAVDAGLRMVARVEEMGNENLIPKIRVGIGINSGRVIAGNLGNASRRFYSLTGKNVIIAARIEQLNKQHSSQLLISGFTYDKLTQTPEATDLGTSRLKGIENEVRIFQLA